jgi:multidrug efflux system membrane fusion protein
MIDVQPRPSSPRQKKFWFLGIAALIVVALVVGKSLASKDAKSEAPRMVRAVPVLVDDVTLSHVPMLLASVGTVEAMETVSVRAQASGQVLEVGFQEGKPVKKGQMLFKLDPAPLQASLKQAEASLARDRAQLAQAKADARRYQDLLAQGFVSRQQAEQMTSSVAALEATVQADQAVVENAKVQLSYTTIVSPIDGVAGDRQVDVGNLVTAGGTTPLLVINRVSPVFVSFPIPQNQIDRVRRYQAEAPILVKATPRGGQPVTGKVVFLDNAVDPSTGTLKLKAEFPNASGALVPGQFADVQLTLTTERNRITAPAQAVQPSQTGHYAFVVNEDLSVSEREVKLDRIQGDLAVVVSGLNAGDRVVIDGTLQLRDGAKVELRDGIELPAKPSGKPHGANPQGGKPQGERSGR